MKSGKPIKIVASGSYLPQIVISTEIEEAHGIPKGWSAKYSGVESRHHVSFESNGYMGARAVENALKKANLKMNDIDLMISASATFDYPLPNQASVIKSEIPDSKLVDFATLDIDSSCLSFVSAFEIAASLLNGKQYKTIVIVSSEISSKGLNPNNFETITLFGDGAVAFILQYDESSDSRFYKATQKNYTEGVLDSCVKGGGNKYFFKDHPYSPVFHSFAMNGKKLMHLALKYLPAFMNDFFEELPINLIDVDVIIPHQASLSAIMIFEKLYDFKPNQMKGNLKTHGNCIATSIPMLLHDTIENGEINRGELCFLVGTAAGFSIGGALIKY
jgi:3-oxoacyl-[acyl-carrier-protein] synthase-3